MKCAIVKRMMLIVAGGFLLLVTGGTTMAQRPEAIPRSPQTASMGKGMGLLTPTLMEVGIQSRFFLLVGDQIKMTEEQRSQITEIAFQFQKIAGEKRADLGVAEAEMQRLLSRDQINLAQVKAKLNEIQSLEFDVEYAGIESVIKAIKVLTHDQHLLIMTMLSTPAPQKPNWQVQ